MRFSVLILLVSFTVLNMPACAEENRGAFIILKALVLDEDRTIKNICLFRKRPCTYLEPSKSFTEVKPGKYRLWNIDFTDNAPNGRGNIFFDENIQFSFKKNRVYFIGQLELSQRRGGKYKMEFKQDISMLIQACRDMPEIALDFPLANAETGKEIGVTCGKVLTNDT